MPAHRRGIHGSVEYVILRRDSNEVDVPAAKAKSQSPTKIVNRLLRRTAAGQQSSGSVDIEFDSDDDLDEVDLEDNGNHFGTPIMPSTSTTAGAKAGSQPSLIALADNDPTETIIVSFQPPPPPKGDREGRISQTTEHLLIAAGSIGATIIIVMIILGVYTMRKRGLTISDVIRNSKDTVRRRHAPPPPPKYLDRKYDDDHMYVGRDLNAPRKAAAGSRSGSLSTQTPLHPLGRSDSFNLAGLDRKDANHRSFLLDAAPPARNNSHRRDISATPSSPVLPIQDTRQSASSRNTRSLVGDEDELRYSDSAQQRNGPAPPTFKQFLSNRPTISQRPGFGGGMMSRFSWTNSNAPQTPREASRDTVTQATPGRDSFMTQRSSVPRFRTIDSWVNQQSTRVEEQRLKQQFRNTQSSFISDGSSDDVPEVPAVPIVPKPLTRMNSLPGKDIKQDMTKHKRHDTTTTIQTAPIFKVHPGTEVRFSRHSTVPSEVLDMGRKNVAL